MRLTCLSLLCAAAIFPLLSQDRPAPRKEAVVQFDLEAGGVALDAKALRRSAETSLLGFNQEVVPLEKADPATALTLGIALKVTPRAPGRFYGEVSLRITPPKGAKAGTSRHLACAVRTEAGLPGALGALMTQAFATCFPGGNPALRHPAAQHATIRVYPTAPACPPEYRDKGLQTRVIVRLQVDEEGLPISAQMVTGPPELEAAALDYALTMVFEPAMAGGVAQKAQYTVPVPFVL